MRNEAVLHNGVQMYREFAALALALSLAPPAQAFELAGATATHEWRQFDYGYHETHFTGAIELSFGAGFGAQLGLKNTNSPSTPDNGSFGHEVHLLWRPDFEGLSLGVFHGEEAFASDWYTYDGIEAKYEFAGFTGEVAVWDYKGSALDARHSLVELGYQINERFGAYLGHTRRDYNPGGGAETTRTYLGGSVALAQGFSVFGEYGEESYDGISVTTESVSLGLRYDFGKGVTFGQRSLTDISSND